LEKAGKMRTRNSGMSLKRLGRFPGASRKGCCMTKISPIKAFKAIS
jgi:hypothetical protein